MSPTTRVAVETFWEYWAFALNSVVFLLIGLEVDLGHLLASWRAIVTAFLVVTLARGVVVFGVSFLLRRTAERIPWTWSAVVTWAGLRGALSMVLVLGLPATFAHREVLVNMTFGVVVLSILVQGTTMSRVLARLGIVGLHDAERSRLQLARGRLRSATAAMDELQRLERGHALTQGARDRLARAYEERARTAEAELRGLEQSAAALHDEETRRAWRRLLEAEKAALQQSLQEGLLGQEAYDELVADANARLAQGPGDDAELESSSSGDAPASERPGTG